MKQLKRTKQKNVIARPPQTTQKLKIFELTFPLVVSLKVRRPKKITRRLNPNLKSRVFSCLKFTQEKNKSKKQTKDLCKVHLPVSLDRETAEPLRHRSLVFFFRCVH